MPRSLKNWLDSYVKYVAESESPERYKLWSGISAISATLKKRVFIDRVFYKIYPQQYIVLVGPPGIGKGAAIHPAINLVKKADTSNIIADRVTAEKAVERLKNGFTTTIKTTSGGINVATEHTATIVVPELPVYLNASSWTLEFMCEMWDRNEWEYDTKGRGTFQLKDLCVGLLGGCVPDFIRKLNSHDATAAVSGGFTSRCVFIYENKKGKRIPFPSKNGSNSVEQQLVDDLHEIANLEGEFSFAPDARALFEHYYNNLQTSEFESDVLIGFKERITAHMFKTAMTLAVSESDALVIELRHLKQAMDLIHRVRDELDICFRGVGESSLVMAQDKVMRYIEHKGICSRTDILKALHRNITDEDLTKVLFIIEQIGFATLQDVGGKKVYFHNKKAAAAATGRP